ncbi:MAG: hypothetical protein M0C28_35485 [Candidatus Moduliflexus flocculans]|nr:hypothetical protein [Candidatus Moduliflexus flocculans]
MRPHEIRTQRRSRSCPSRRFVARLLVHVSPPGCLVIAASLGLGDPGLPPLRAPALARRHCSTRP